MSYQASAWAVELDDLSPGEKLLLLVIAHRADSDGVCIAGRERLAREACCRPETVTQNMKRLEGRGLVARFERRRPNGSRTSDYTVLAPFTADRGPLHDADPDEYPEHVAEAARASGEDFSGEVSGVGQVRKTGGPEKSVEQSGGSNDPRKSARATGGDLLEVWAHYQDVMPNGRRCKLDPQRRLVIQQALKVRSVAECCAAIDGLAQSDYHVSGGYLDVRYALRGGGRSPSPEATIDRMGAIAAGQVSNGNGNGAVVKRELPGGGTGHFDARGNRVYFDHRPWGQLSKNEQDSAREMMEMGVDPATR